MKHITLTTDRDGLTVSSLELYYVELPSRKLAVIEEVWTDPTYRKQGLATALIEQAIQQAREWGTDCIELTVRQDAPHIKAFYEGFGFVDRLNTAMRLPLKEMKPWKR